MAACEPVVWTGLFGLKYPSRREVSEERGASKFAHFGYRSDQGGHITITIEQLNSRVWMERCVDIGNFFVFLFGINCYSSFQLRVIVTGSLMITSGRTLDNGGERDRETDVWGSV